MKIIKQFVKHIYEKYGKILNDRLYKDRLRDTHEYETEFQILIKSKIPEIIEHCKVTTLFLGLLGFDHGIIKLVIKTYKSGNRECAWDIIFAHLITTEDYLKLSTVFYLVSEYNTEDDVQLYKDVNIDIPKTYNEFCYKYTTN